MTNLAAKMPAGLLTMVRRSALLMTLGTLLGLPLFDCTPACEDVGSCACESDADCAFGNETRCSGRACNAGVCEVSVAEAGAACEEVSNGVCDGVGECVARLALGQPCDADGVCDSGICRDAVCCDTACDTPCVSCALSGSAGTCSQVALGSDPDGDCSAEQVCDDQPACVGGAHRWAVEFATVPLDDIGPYDVAVDSQGNTYVVGAFSSSIDFGDGPVTTPALFDGFLVKLDPSGGVIYSRRFSDDAALVQGVAVDANDDVWIMGLFSTSVNFGTATLTSAGSADLFLAKFDPQGNHLFSRKFNATGADFARFALGPSGELYMSGEFSGTLLWGNSTINAANGSAYLAKLDATGSEQWFKQYTKSGIFSVFDLKVDSFGGPAIAGRYTGTFDVFDGDPFVSEGSSTDAYVLKLNASGDIVFKRSYGSIEGANISALAFDSNDEMIIAGSFSGSVDLGNMNYPSKGATDAFVAKLSAVGDTLWSQAFGGTSFDSCLGASVQAGDGVVLFGAFRETIDVGGGNIDAQGKDGMFWLRLSGDGDYLYQRVFRADNIDYAGMLRPAASDGVAFTGLLADGVDLDGAVLSGSGVHIVVGQREP